MNKIKASVPTTDYRMHPNTAFGDSVIIGHGVAHHDIVNISFYGRVYDTAIIAYPLAKSDRYQDPRTMYGHIMYLRDLLRDIQQSCVQELQNHYLTPEERRAKRKEVMVRRGSICVLYDISRERYYRPRRPSEQPELEEEPEQEPE